MKRHLPRRRRSRRPDAAARYVFLVNGARLEGYRSIVASGTKNIWSMHYYRTNGELTNVGTLEMLSATYAVLKRLASPVSVRLVSLSRGVEQLESLRFESINPTFLLRAHKPAPDWVV